jgi:hypothetical protein
MGIQVARHNSEANSKNGCAGNHRRRVETLIASEIDYWS